MVSASARFFRNKLVTMGAREIIFGVIVLLISLPTNAFEPSNASMHPLLVALNEYRINHDRQPLVKEPRLTQAAESQARQSAKSGQLDHTGHLGLELGARLNAEGYLWSYAGENLAYGQSNAPTVIDQWSNSPSHRRVMLGETYSQAGIAMVKNENGTRYWVLIAAAPRNEPGHRNE